MNFRKINVFLDDYISQVAHLEEYTPVTYEEKMKRLYEIACCIYREGCMHFEGIDTLLLPNKKIPKEETIALVLSYFKEIDSSFESGLLTALKKESIHFYLKGKMQQGEKVENQPISSSSVAGIVEGKK